ncbi:hypothetical protein ARMGADRAFT_1016141, partial [Armillaria gallica]
MPHSSSKEHPGRNSIVQLTSSVTITTGASIFKSVETSIVTIVTIQVRRVWIRKER